MAFHLEQDENGNPVVLLANVPNAGVSNVDTNAKSGNANHDVRSGKFGSGAKKAQDKAQRDLQNPSEVPAQQKTNPAIDPQTMDLLRRRSDLVRAGAREIHELGPGDVQDFLAGRVTDPSQVDVQAFLHDVHEARLSDIVDILDSRLRKSSAAMLTTRRLVKVAAPKAWIGTAFNGLQDDDVISVLKRLEARGHASKEILKTALGNIRDAGRREALQSAFALDDKPPAPATTTEPKVTAS
jgi:hypothetical protein